MILLGCSPPPKKHAKLVKTVPSLADYILESYGNPKITVLQRETHWPVGYYQVPHVCFLVEKLQGILHQIAVRHNDIHFGESNTFDS